MAKSHGSPSLLQTTRLLHPCAVLIAALWLVTAGAWVGSEAKAQSRTCTNLERQLASVGSSKRNNRAARAQSRQLQSLNQQMKRKGCAQRRRFFQREAHSSCRALRSRRDRAQRNYQALSQSGGGAARRTKTQIQREMRRRGCRSGTQTAINRGTPLLDQIFGQGALKKRREEVQNNQKRKKRKTAVIATERPNVPKNAERTMCVRSCDGYFFPVNLSGNEGGETTAEAACTNLCPGREMALYTHKPASQSVVDMVSVTTGEPYTALKTAFAFRQKFNPACSCNYGLLKSKVSDDPPEIVETRKKLNEAATLARIALPIFRGDPAEDTETAANRRGGLTAEAIRALNAAPSDAAALRNKRVRIIGDAYFPNR